VFARSTRRAADFDVANSADTAIEAKLAERKIKVEVDR